MVRRGHSALHFTPEEKPAGRQEKRSHGAQPEDGGKRFIDGVLEASISFYPVGIQPPVNNTGPYKAALLRKKRRNYPRLNA